MRLSWPARKPQELQSRRVILTCHGREPRLAQNRPVVLGYRLHLEAKSLQPLRLTSGSPLCAAWLTRRQTPGC
jgi:hypothetical protein